ncbi:MAG: hypothetical protein WAU68_01975 [Vitreimonas sp.]
MIDDPRPPKAFAVTLKVKDTQEHLLRRLGQALVLHWEEMPDGLQDVLIDQAVMVTDRDLASQNEIETFIRAVKSVPVTN